MAVHQDCRMYEAKFPEVDDVVMVQVTKIAEMGAYVNLLEYNGIEGMILLSELSRRRIRSINKLIKVGRQEAVMVLRVDKDKGYIDLSKRRVNQEDAAKVEERFQKSKMVHSIMRHVAETTGANLEELYRKIGWPLYRIYGHAFDAMKTMVADEGAGIFKRLEEENKGPLEVLTPEVHDALLKNIKRRMTPQPVKIRADVELTCFQYGGIEHIKAAMRAAEATSTEECAVKMKLVAPPLYVLYTQTLDKQKGVDVLTLACEACGKSIEGAKGKLVIKEAARAVSERDDRLLAEKLEALENANKEVDGDADSEEEDEGMGDIDVEAGPATLDVWLARLGALGALGQQARGRRACRGRLPARCQQHCATTGRSRPGWGGSFPASASKASLCQLGSPGCGDWGLNAYWLTTGRAGWLDMADVQGEGVRGPMSFAQGGVLSGWSH
eukprot:CAMPEP_0202868596 /NCGR_PEP_ID=MMETSP1391-20130828/10964_1 /ASSEMBLY_ACC=CAM_ASM_000867 /TAXON_ID=1034604 /ORGANISM="Chlamydomonas leiostraca, Strain SAG 11-49" /LENGTH=440 /DNA_ID=CAMNT_0049548781 /DNA_START=154 /DNA_END=1477 /DNA_ORIENTATION=+